MVANKEFRALAAAIGIELRPDLDVVMTTASCLPALIDLVEGSELVVLGLDGFRLHGSVVVPSMEHIADFSEITGSWLTRVEASAGAARRVARGWEQILDLIEVTLDGLD